MKLTRSKIVDLYALLTSPQVKDARFKRTLAFSMARLTYTLEPVVQAMRAAADVCDGVKKYHERRVALLRNYARKGEKGEPLFRMTPQGQAFDVAPEDQCALDRELTALQDGEFKDALAEQAQRDKELEALGKQEEEVAVELPLSMFPEDVPMNLLQALYPLILDDSVG